MWVSRRCRDSAEVNPKLLTTPDFPEEGRRPKAALERALSTPSTKAMGGFLGRFSFNFDDADINMEGRALAGLRGFLSLF